MSSRSFLLLRSALSRRDFIGRLSLGTAGLALASRLRAADALAGRKLGIALCGLGSYAQGQLAPALKLTKNCYLAGVVTGDRAKGLAWAKEHGFPEKNIFSYDTMDRLVEAQDIDIVYVVTPNGLHLRDTLAAAKAGKHVISEKPMANTAAEAEAMIAACRAAKTKLSIGYRLHFDPYHQELMRHAREKDFGPLRKMTGKRAFVMSTWRWRADKKLAGGGPLMDLGVYLIQGACMAQNHQAPVAVTAHEETKKRPDIARDTEEALRFTLEFADGARAEFFTSYQDTGDMFRAEGEKGWIEFKDRAFSYRGLVVDTSAGALHFDPPVNQQALQMDDFAQCVRENRESRIAGEMGLRDMKIIDAIYEAMRTGRRVEVKA
jgi:glucose-fructose oxidoreductase